MATVRRMKIFSLANLRLLGRDCSGATTIENTLLAALIAIAILSGVKEVRSVVYSVFAQTENQICNAVNGGGCGGGAGAGAGDDDDDGGDDDDDDDDDGG